nr:odorant receptor 16.1 [Papilio dardanus]
MEIDFNKMFRIMIFAMRVNRSHPDIPRDKKWALQFICFHGTFFIMFCALVYSIIFYDLKNKDFTQACSNGAVCIVFIIVTLKYCVMLYYQKLLKGMIQIMKNDYKLSTELPSEEQEIVLHYALKGKGVMKLLLVIPICTACLFPVKAIILMIYYKIIGDFKFVLLYDLTYPAGLEEHKNEPGTFAFLFLAFLFYDLYAMFMYIAFAPLGSIFMLHVCGQLELVKKRVLTIYPNNSFDHEKVLNSFKDVILHLQKIYSFVEDLKTSFKLLYELTLKATSVILPIILYMVIQSFKNGEINLEFITIIIGAITLSAIPCYYSDLLMETGESVRLAIYSSKWEMYWDKRVRSLLLMALVRTERPIAVRSMFRPLCLDALTDVFHQSYAIFNLMNAAWN